MAQAPQKSETKKAEATKEPEMSVTMPGAPPTSDTSEQSDRPVPEATKAEQEAGRKTKEEYVERLKAEQEAGEAIVKRNQEMTGNPRPTQ